MKLTERKLAPAPTQKKDESWVRPSSSADLDHVQLNLYGPPGSGKTWCALSASAKWPEDPCAPRSEYVLLDDLLYLQYDIAALVGLLPHKIRVEHVISVPDKLAEMGDFIQVMKKMTPYVRRYLKDFPHIKYVVHDTITSMDQMSLAHWSKVFPDMRKESRKLFGAHLNTHRAYWSEMVYIPNVANIYIFHERFVEEPSGTEATPIAVAKAQAKRLNDSLVNIIPHATGTGLNMYTNHASIEWSLVTTPRPKNAGYNRKLCPIVVDGRRVKNRFQTLFPGPMEPNLRKVFEKIRNSAKADLPDDRIVDEVLSEKTQSNQPTQPK